MGKTEIILIGICGVLLAVFFGMAIAEIQNSPYTESGYENHISTPETTEKSLQDDYYDNYGGMGMTYTGKMGLEIAPGMVMDFDNGELQPGFGF